MAENGDMALDKQVVFICGAAGLVGQRFVEVCLQAGANVVASDINTDVLDELKAHLEKAGISNDESLLLLSLDLSIPEQIENALNLAVDKFGLVTDFVNTAYPRNQQYGRAFFEVEYADFCENLNLNIATTFSASQVFARYFQQQQSGNIINLGSIYGVVAPDFDIYPEPMTMPVEYAAIKAGVIHLTKYMAQLLRKDGVRVNCISPGGILDSQPDTFLQRYNAKCGQQGMLSSEHLDSTLLYLLSKNSRAVTGQNIVVDDGFSL